MDVLDSKCSNTSSQLDVNQYHTMVVASSVIREKLQLLEKVARTDSSVLILGESGVGKELFAEQIHLRSTRSQHPFIRVNCAALPDAMLESELFGHVRGAFTDAIKDRKGRFELADHGTLFLDEIADMPMSLQSKVLRVLQSHCFERLGSSNTIRSDIRIVAATNKNIEKLVEQGAFRSDLYFRLNVLPLYIPALRARKDDIMPLAQFFLKKFNWETKKNFEGFSDDAVKLLLKYSWPGNIRELENIVERACVVGQSSLIQVADFMLDCAVSSEAMDESRIGYTIVDGNASGCTLKNAIDDFKRSYILRVLADNDNNQTATAQQLNIQRTYLSRLMKELSIRISGK